MPGWAGSGLAPLLVLQSPAFEDLFSVRPRDSKEETPAPGSELVALIVWDAPLTKSPQFVDRWWFRREGPLDMSFPAQCHGTPDDGGRATDEAQNNTRRTLSKALSPALLLTWTPLDEL